jgi:ferredoxin
MDCFLEGPNFLVINPDECIDCSMCVTECPVDAIVSGNEIGQDQKHFIEINKTLSKDPQWKRITRSKDPLPAHAEWAEVKDKLQFLQRTVALEKADDSRSAATQPASRMPLPLQAPISESTHSAPDGLKVE